MATARQRSTGQPTATTAAAPAYTDNAQLAPAAAYVDPVTTYAGTDRLVVHSGRQPSATAEYTGMVAYDRAEAVGANLAEQTGLPPATATGIIRDYRSRTGTYPDLSSLGSLGNYSSGASEDGSLTEASGFGGLVSGGLSMWILISVIGLAAVVLFSRKR